MVDQSNNHGAVGLDLSKTASNSRFLRSCPPSRPSDMRFKNLHMTRGQRIVKALLDKSVTKAEIARECHTDWKSVHAWANCWYSPDFEHTHFLQRLWIKKQQFPF